MDGQRGPLPLPLIDAEKVKAAYSLLYRDEYKDALLGEPDGVDRIAGGLATKANFFAGDKTVTGDRSSDESGRRAVFFAQVSRPSVPTAICCPASLFRLTLMAPSTSSSPSVTARR